MEDSQHVTPLKTALGAATEQARSWFEAKAIKLTKAEFGGRSPKGKSPRCGVYAYYGPQSAPLYVGQSKRRVKLRLHDKTSPHAQKPWWGDWSEMRFLPVENETDRLVLELLLILAYAPPHNQKPLGVQVSALFAPNSSFKPSPLRGLGQNPPFSGGPA